MCSPISPCLGPSHALSLYRAAHLAHADDAVSCGAGSGCGEVDRELLWTVVGLWPRGIRQVWYTRRLPGSHLELFGGLVCHTEGPGPRTRRSIPHGAAARIGPDETRVSDRAEQARVTKRSAAFLVDQLEAADYVELAPDLTDRRARLVRLTGRARRVAEVADAEVERVLVEWADHVGEQRLRLVHETLRHLREITDPWLDPRRVPTQG